jgi:hypothetical protein
MTTQALLNLLHALRANVNPLTGEDAGQESRLLEPDVRGALNRLIRAVNEKRQESVDIPEQVIMDACRDLRELGYAPSVGQLAKVFIGSRSIVDRRLKGIPAYNQFRGVFTRKMIHKFLMAYHRQFPERLPEFPPKNKVTVHQPWKTVTFFEETGFDHLEEAKAVELYRAVQALGLRRKADRLPEHIVRARAKYPRSFEPWTREEQALLVEAMCYTNDREKLADIFGRTPTSIVLAGQQLIYESEQAHRTA